MNTSPTPLPRAADRPRRARWSLWLAGAATALVLAACGGGGSADSGGTQSGLSVGTVTGFGSIIVDGVRYDDKNVSVSLDTESGAPDAGTSVEVKLGQHVELTFTGSESNSSASTVKVSAEVVGTVSAIAPDLVVAGQTIKINTDPAAGPVTVFEGYTSAADIAIGDRVEVHGAPTADKTVLATRIERRPAAEPWVRVAGSVSGLAADGSSFQLGGLTVNVSDKTRIVPASATLANGLRVIVWSNTAVSGNTLDANFIRIKRHQGDVTADARIAGAITDCTPTCDASFKVGGISVDASGAEFVNGTKADLANGRWVELRGTLDTTTNTLVATKVKFRKIEVPHEEVKLRGAITDFVDATNFKVRGVPVTTDASTVIGSSCTAPLADGTLVSITGSVSGFTVLAKTIDCFTVPDGFIVEGKGTVLTLDPATKTFTLEGALFANLTLTYSDATRFESGTSATDLKVGSKLEVSGSVTGTAMTVTRIEFEDEVSNPVPGVAIFRTEGVASNVVLTAGKLTSLTVNGMDFVAGADVVVVTRDGALVDGAKVKLLFTKDGTTNTVVFVRTDK
jgi:hypothetical protein